MDWRTQLSEEEQLALDNWLSRVMHDLVKYLEMMPRSLDWDALDDDDLECIWESVFETRTARGQVQSAEHIWAALLDDLPGGLSSAVPGLGAISEALTDLTERAKPLAEPDADVDLPKLREILFSVGHQIRALRDVS